MPVQNLRRITEAGTFLHVYNKGVENRSIFQDEDDYQVFLGFLEDYLSPPKDPESNKKDFTINGHVFRGVPHQPKNYFKKVELFAFSLNPNHFHLLLHQKTKKSLQAFIRSLCTRYSIYFNKKYNRTGALFDGPYKSVKIMHQSGLLLLTHYFHNEGGYSTYPEYLGTKETPWVKTKIVLSAKFKEGNYKDFVEKYVLNKDEEEHLEHLIIETAKHHLERSDLEQVRLKPWARIPELLTASVVFALLLGFSLRNIVSVARNPQVDPAALGTNTTLASPTPTFTLQPKTMLSVTNIDATSSVNIRREPTVESEKIGEAKDGDSLEFVSKISDWYEVRLTDDSTGFIFAKYIEAGEKDN